jgi:hypothetical protein
VTALLERAEHVQVDRGEDRGEPCAVEDDERLGRWVELRDLDRVSERACRDHRQGDDRAQAHRRRSQMPAQQTVELDVAGRRRPRGIVVRAQLDALQCDEEREGRDPRNQVEHRDLPLLPLEQGRAR